MHLHVASEVAKPDVISSVGEEEAKGLGPVPNHPVRGGAEEPVLERNKYCSISLENKKLVKYSLRI